MTVYLIRNLINGRWYIGKTKYSAAKRWLEHKRDAKRGTRRSIPLRSAIAKYGADSFSVQALVTVGDKHALDFAEMLAISLFRLFDSGRSYNMTSGGDGGVGMIYTDEQRRASSERRKGRPCLAHVREAFIRGVTGGTWNRGRIHGAVIRANMAAAHVGKSNVWSEQGRRNHAAACRTPEYRQQMSERSRAAWARRKAAV